VTEYTGEDLTPKASVRSISKKCTMEHFIVEWQKGEPMDDSISRQAAINAVCMEWCGVKHQDCKHPFDAEKDDYYWCDGCETALRTLPDLPSAEPEKACIAKITLSEEQVREAFEKAKSEIVQVLPSAQPRPRGRWLPDNRNYYEERFVCSVCERSYEVDTCMGEPTWDFCPGCGADMRGEQDGRHDQQTGGD